MSSPDYECLDVPPKTALNRQTNEEKPQIKDGYAGEFSDEYWQSLFVCFKPQE